MGVYADELHGYFTREPAMWRFPLRDTGKRLRKNEQYLNLFVELLDFAKFFLNLQILFADFP